MNLKTLRLIIPVWLMMAGLFPYITHAQQRDSLKQSNQKKHIDLKIAVGAPLALITTGLIVSTDNEVFDRYEIAEARNHLTPMFRTHIDDYVQYAPIIAVAAMDAMGMKATHDIANQTALLIKTEIIMTAMVIPLKKITAVPRPDTGEPTSFPSGHTAQAFAAATFLHKEYGKDHPWYSVLAYTTATGVGVLRVLNNRHWASDVLAGAGIGILATNLAYLTHQNKCGKKNKRSNVVVMPSYSNRTLSFSAVIPIRYRTFQ